MWRSLICGACTPQAAFLLLGSPLCPQFSEYFQNCIKTKHHHAPVQCLFPLPKNPFISSSQPAFPNTEFPFSQHYQYFLLMVQHSISSFLLFRRVLNIFLFIHISQERKAEKNHLTPLPHLKKNLCFSFCFP
jgi:hypothetical protein